MVVDRGRLIVIWFHLIYFFFFKQKTAYEMRISDWSSDVCSSDVCSSDLRALAGHHPSPHAGLAAEGNESLHLRHGVAAARLRAGHLLQLDVDFLARKIAARRAVDETAFDLGRKQPAVLIDRTRGPRNAEHHRKRVGLA